MPRFVIIGGEAAGMSAAMAIRRLLPQDEIAVFEQGKVFSYAQCGLPYYIQGRVQSPDHLVARKEEVFRGKYGITTFPMHSVTEIMPGEKKIAVKNLGSGDERYESFDSLLIATGARAELPSWPGRDLGGVVTLKDIPDSVRIIKLLQEDSCRKVVILGGGAVGLEMAEVCRSYNKDVTMIVSSPQVARLLDTDMASLVRDELERNGVSVLLSQKVNGTGGRAGRVIEVVTSEGSVPADLVLVGKGVLPNSGLAAGAGIELGAGRAIKVDNCMRTSQPGIWAAGDCATQYHLLKQADDYIPLGTTANKQGVVAGMNMAGRQKSFAGVVGTAILKVFDLGVARTGLSEREAGKMNIKYAVVKAKANSRAGYYPGAKPVEVKIVYEVPSGRLLGGQFTGPEGVDKGVDVLATALYAGMRVDQLEELDLAYAPPFSPVWAPLQQAARRA